ncbi:hypothetical protein [Polyangium fumosum]|uniref:Uncharacterized protein n=1 Tax=Polyangium fumosum TaxID=889272 RepID=A0A4U1IV25_9BACT|nr:hypothetical protein [Polyangium fumosum]TKC98282.1 hypothetical protein E8A74_41660 [Polyangium fumosum]
MPDTLSPTSAADTPTLYPASPWLTWVPAPDYWNVAPTMFLPPPKPAPPVPIPEGVILIPTDLLPPPVLEHAPRAPAVIPPPQLLGPVADVAASEPPASVPAPAPAVAPAVVPTPLPLDAFPLERCARLDAALALDPAAGPSILEQHHLDHGTWRALRQHWQGALRAALRVGDPAPLRAYDDAYVGELERVRGAITPEQHASLTRASERGARAEGLATLGLPVAAVLHMERVLLRRRAN